MKRICLLVIGGLLVACTAHEIDGLHNKRQKQVVPLAPTQFDIDYADEASPSNPDLASLYNRSCISCHSIEGAGAPLTGHEEDWDARLSAAGLESLLKSTKYGKGTMPAMGLCMDCTDEDFIQLIEYMGRKE